ncbi:MAG: PAS domain-containing protein [Nitrospirota bacterium]|nr:PAS domain-containing protein [Nitrospirota bacterium]
MFKTKLIYRFLINFLIFSIALILPLSFSLRKDLKGMFANVEVLVEKGKLKDTRAIQDEFFKEIFTHLMSISFYAFFLAFILSIFSSRRFLKPIKALYAGAEAVKGGNLDVKIPVYSADELGEVTTIFNEMLTNLKTKTEELQNKDTYVKTMMDALWVVDLNDIIVDINPAFTKMFGYERNQVIGSSIYDFLDTENAMIMKKELGLKRHKGEHSTYEINIIAKNGSQIPVLITGAPIIRDGEVVGKIGIIKDFREQTKLVKELKESRDYLETIMNSIEDSILIINNDYRILKANVAALTRYGNNITEKKCHEITHNSSRPCWMEGEDCPIQGVFTNGGTWRTIHEHYDEGGSKCYVEVIASPVRNSEGKVVEALEIMRDVTERVKHMDEINRRNRELVLLNSIASIINQSLKAEEIFSNVLDRLRGALDMDGGCIFILDEETRTLVCSCHMGIAEQCTSTAVRIKLGDDIPGRVAVTGEVMTSSDLSSDSRITLSAFKDTGIKGYCCIPVKGKDRVLGVYCLFKSKEHFFTMEEERLLRAVGEMTGLALENIRFYEKMKEMFETQKNRRFQEQRDLLELSSELTSARDMDEVIHCTSSLIKEFLASDAIFFWEKRDNNSLVLRYFDGMQPQTATLKMDVPSTETYATAKGTHISVYDINTDERFLFTEDLKSLGFRSALSMPVVVGENVLGVFTAMTRTSREYRDDEIHFLRIISSIFGVALERSQIYEKRRIDHGLAEAILNTMSEGVCTVDTNGVIISVNRSAERILGIPATNLVGRDYTEIFSEPIEGNACPIVKSLKGETASAEFIPEKGKGNVIHVSSLPLMDSANRIYGAVQVFRDITREKEIDRMKTDIIRSVSHEFRTPLSAIVGLTEMLMDGEIAGARAREYLLTIYEEGMRLTEMVSDLLSISKIESGKEPIRFSIIDFSEIVESIKRVLNTPVANKNISLLTEVDPDIKGFYGDREKLRQLLLNLLDNAIKYSDPGCYINLRVRYSGEYVILEVSDTGWGIPENDIANLSKHFYRGAHGERTKGTGLGLALCKEIVRIHHGNIDIRSRLNKGTSVIITLPYRRMKDA